MTNSLHSLLRQVMRQSSWQRLIFSPLFAARTFQKYPARVMASRRLVYFEDLGLVYNRVPKNANTTTTVFFAELSGLTVRHHSEAILASRRLPWSVFLDLPSFHAVVIIRNPYSRVLSAFLDKFGNQGALYRSRYGDFEPTPMGFRRFVDYLKDRGTSGNPHWDFQQRLIPFPLTAYDSVIRFESYATGVSEMLQFLEIEFDSSKLQTLFPTDTQKKTHSESYMAQFYDEKSIREIGNLYESDFTFLGYSKEFQWR